MSRNRAAEDGSESLTGRAYAGASGVRRRATRVAVDIDEDAMRAVVAAALLLVCPVEVAARGSRRGGRVGRHRVRRRWRCLPKDAVATLDPIARWRTPGPRPPAHLPRWSQGARLAR